MFGTKIWDATAQATETGASQLSFVTSCDVTKARDTQTIMLVDDDFTLARLVREVIEGFGYDVALAHSGSEAEKMVIDGAQIDLLLTDIRLKPGFGGFELAQRVRDIHPSLPVLYISGNDQYTQAELGAVRAPILLKPVPPDDLEKAISEALAR